MFEQEGQIFIERTVDDPLVYSVAYERYLSDQAIRGVVREQEGYDGNWHMTPNLVREKEEVLEHPDTIPWDDNGTHELSITPEQLIVGLRLAIEMPQQANFVQLTAEQVSEAQSALKALKPEDTTGLKANTDSFTWPASLAAQ